MELVKQIQSMKSSDDVLPLKHSFSKIHAIIRKILNQNPSERPRIQEIEKAIVTEEIESSESFISSLKSSIHERNSSSKDNRCWKAMMMSENEDLFQDVTLFGLGKELLVFFAGEQKSRFSLAIIHYNVFADNQCSSIELKNSLRVNYKLVIEKDSDYQAFIQYLRALECYIERV